MQDLVIFANVKEAKEFINTQRFDCSKENYKAVVELGYDYIEENIIRKIETSKNGMFINTNNLNIKQYLQEKNTAPLKVDNNYTLLFVLIGFLVFSLIGALVGYLLSQEYSKKKSDGDYTTAVQKQLVTASLQAANYTKDKIKSEDNIIEV